MWQPIETAPRNGKYHIRWSAAHGAYVCNQPAGYMPGRWEKRGKKWHGMGEYAITEATHWMPLPEPPHDTP